MSAKFNYTRIQGVKGNTNVTDEFIKAVEDMAARMQTKPEYILSAMSFETGGTFSPSIQNGIGATGLIQFLKPTAIGLGTTTDKLKAMTAVEQLKFVEKYFSPFKGKLDTLEAVYTSILSGSPKKPADVLFRAGTPAYKMNPLDWNADGEITAGEATTIVGARMFGGVKAVQQRLVEIGVVPANLRAGFADGSWGTNTSNILAIFQKSKGIAATGLMNEETGFALFPDAGELEKEKILQTGDKGDAVKRLQDALVMLGYMEMEKIGTGFGTFGPQTKAAVEAFQKHLSLTANGKASDIEQKIFAAVKAGIGKGNPNTPIVKSIQDRLVKLKYLTQAQVDTGHGTFGLQTETAVKKFQRDNNLQQSGIVETANFKILFNKEAIDKQAKADDLFAKDGKFYTVVSGILFTEALQAKVENVAKEYFAITGNKLIVTSGYRPPDRQAAAMYNKIVNEGETTVRNIYANKALIDEILAAFRANKGNPQAAVPAMQKAIENQMKRNPPGFISNHLLSNAVDVRKPTTNLTSLRTSVNRVGGRIVVEGNHFHIELH